MASGCLSQRWLDKLPELLPEIDGFFGNRIPSEIVKVADNVLKGLKPVYAPESSSEDSYNGRYRKDFFGFNRSVYVKISDGCNHACRFCVIPAIKGTMLSRPFGQIVNEVESLLAEGVFELNFIAQDVLAYGYDKNEINGSGLVKLLRTISGKYDSDRNYWIRLLYLYPDEFSGCSS